MKLSIGMIVKNEEKYLERCLKGIKPILDNVESELIITDTGSTDDTVKIAKEFTDKVLYFDWCNDFAAARNIALKQSCGEWFMFIDADEILSSCKNIIDFFNSGEYKKYNSATYVIRSVYNSGESSDFDAQRLTKITNDTQFDGIVHERLNTFGEPIKRLSDVADHYGYYYETADQKENKFKRNSELLLKKLREKRPVDPMIYIQLYETYLIGNMRDEADMYMDKGIEYCKKNSNVCLAALFCRKAYLYMLDEDYENAILACKDYSKNCTSRSADKEIYAIRATAEYRLGKYKETLISLDKFFTIYNDVENGKIHTQDADIINFLASSENNYLPLICVFFAVCIKLKKYEQAINKLPELRIYEHCFDKELVDQIVVFAIQIIQNTSKDSYDCFYKQLDDYGKSRLKDSMDDLNIENKAKCVKLSIGMIVKNEEKNIERCLNGIKPILDNVDSELIITDTGSTDRTVEITKKYTDKVLHYEWTKDFSAARNTAFDIAKGEWFMFLDADEVFENCDGIIDFFDSGEYKRYKSASFVIRNLNGEDKYIDFYPRRMVKRYPDTRFVGIIHEYLYPILEPSKHIDDIALHYGYLYVTFEESQAKFNRNVELMLKTLETENEPHPKIYSQLFDGYGSVFRIDEAFKYLEIGIEKCKKNNDRYIVILYFQKAEYLYRNAEYEKALAVCEEYFSEKKRIKLPALTTDGDIYAYSADSLFALGRCEEAIDQYKKYFEAYRNIKSGKLCTEDMHQKTVEMCSDRVLPGLFNNFLGCCINVGKFNTADMYIQSYPINNKEIKDDALLTLCSRMIIVLENFGYKNTAKYVGKLDERGRRLFVDMLFVRAYTSDFNMTVCDALSKICSNIQKMDLDALLDFRNKACVQYVKHNAAEKIINIWNHSAELKKHNCGRLFCVDVNRCVEDLATIGAVCPENDDNCTDAVKAARILNDCILKKKNGQIKDCILGLKIVVKMYEPTASLVSEYSQAIIKELEEKRPMSEMDRLANTIKRNIKTMISNGQYENAKKMLNEYKQINPNDPEIDVISEMLVENGD